MSRWFRAPKMQMVRLGYRPALDGLRALAIAPVVALHAYGWPGEGSLGVDLFFVLSGFLITVLLLEEHARDGTLALRDFWRRRAARLVPGLLVMLGVYTIATGGAHAWAVLFGATYTSNVANVIEPSAIPWSLGHLWSLAQEEQFYLVWPPLLLVLLRTRPQLLTRVLGGLIVAVIIEKLALLASGASLERLYFAPDAHADPILIGCLVGCLFASPTRPSVSDRVRQFIGPLVLAALVASVLLPGSISRLTAGSPLRTVFALICGVVILAAVSRGSVPQLLALKPLVFVGRISYSLYLWHVPVFAALGATAYDGHPGRSTLAIGIAAAAATLSFYVVERPLRHRWSRRRPRQGALEPAAMPTH